MKEYEKTANVSNLIEETMSKIKTLYDNSTVFGEPNILPDGTTIIPVSKVTLGFIVGGGEYADLSTRRVGVQYPMAGGSGGGVSMSPIGFIASTKTEVKFIPTAGSLLIENMCEKLMKMAGMIKNHVCKDKKCEVEDEFKE